MKKQIVCTAALAALLVGCTSENDVLQEDTTVLNGIRMSAKDVVFENGAATRTDLSFTGSALTFAWAENDVVGIYPTAGGDPVRFPMTQGAGTKNAAFDGGGWALKNSCTYAAYFPFSKENAYKDIPLTAIPLNYTGQKQTGNASTAHLGAYDYMVAKETAPEEGNVSFEFDHLNSFLYVKLEVPEKATFSSLTLEAGEALFVQSATVDLEDGTLTSTNSTKSITLGLEDVEIEANGTLEAWVAIAPADFSGKTLTATVTAKAKVYEASITGKKCEGGIAYLQAGTLTEKPKSAPVGVEAVDLGLTSGTKWANMNVGATALQDYGSYFAWGETEEKARQVDYDRNGDGVVDEKDVEFNYSLDTYAFYKQSDEYDEFGFQVHYKGYTKYVIEDYAGQYGYKGFFDNKRELDLEDDAAYVNWSSGWRMPTYEQIAELLTECEWTWATLSGVNGYKVTGPNGKFIFLPAAGRCEYGNVGDQGYYGYFWSSTANGSNGAYGLDFLSGDQRVSSYLRDFGYSVRAVQNETPAAPATTGTAKATINSVDTDVNWVQLWAGGPKFAEFNVGATSATEYGGYYTWGGTFKNEQGSWQDDHIDGTSDLSCTGDNITDTATKLWGDKWRMPTIAELSDTEGGLLHECDCVWTENYNGTGKNGLLCTGKDAYSSCSVFLPAAGFCGVGDVYDQGFRGYYYPSTADGSDACNLYFDSAGHQDVNYGDVRRSGCSVRAVLNE